MAKLRLGLGRNRAERRTLRKTGLVLLGPGLLAGLAPFAVPADTIVIPFSEITQAIDDSSASADEAINAYLAQELRRQFERLGFDTEAGLVLDEIPIDEITEALTTDCPVPSPYEAHLDATTATLQVDDNSSLSLELDTIRHINITARLSGTVEARANAWVRWGIDVPFVGDCQKFDTDHGWVAVRMPFNIDLRISLQLDPSYDAERVAVAVDKYAVLEGEATVSGGSLSYDFGDISLTELVLRVFEDYLIDELTNRAEQQVADEINTLNNRLNGLDSSGLPDPTIDAFNGTTYFVIEEEEGDRARTRAILDQLGLPELVLNLIDDRGIEILLELVVLDATERDAYLAALGAGLGCEALFDTYEATLETAPIYAMNGSSCVRSDPFGADLGTYYLDAACTNEVAFRPPDMGEFCAERFGQESSTVLGNAGSWLPDPDQTNDPLPTVQSRRWTLVPGSRLNIGVVSIETNRQPFVKQVNYKTIDALPRGDGVCRLEMRIYKSDIGAEGLRPLLALHGGTWQHRGFSFFGIETMISHLTERGFIVFAPFYRLAGESDGNPECNGSNWRELTSDVEDALAWVIEHGPALGATVEDVAVFGQSAGAHLAAWLSAYRPDTVRRALLFYAPSDALEFLKGAVPTSGPYEAYRDFGLGSLATFYGARGGRTELRLDQIDYAGLDSALLMQQPRTLIPDAAFDLRQIDPALPPGYLARCAQLTQTDLSMVNLSQPPEPLMNCLKDDLADFLIQNSFNSPLSAESVPLYMVHGAADTLVPYPQAVNLCGAIADAVLPVDLIDELTTYNCGSASRTRIIKGAEHALDLGICLGPLCPAGEQGSPTRSAVSASLEDAYHWLTEDLPALLPPSPEPVPVPRVPESDTTSGGSAGWLILILLIMLRTGHRKNGRLY